jgi:glycosyltransferase involved in cell wall biosynthesis
MKSLMLSVILPTRDSGAFLRRSVDSILNQTYENFELILVDDSSSEFETRLAKKISELDSRIKYYSNVRRSGSQRTLGHLLNQAIRLSASEFIVRQDADDYAFPTRIEKQIQFLLENNLDLVGSQGINIDESGKYLSSTSLPSSPPKILEYLDYENPFIHTSAVFRKSTYELIGRYNEELTTAQDYDLWFRFSKRKGKIGLVNSNLVAVTRWDGSITARTHILEREANLNSIRGRNSQEMMVSNVPTVIRSREALRELRQSRINLLKNLFYLFSHFNQLALIIHKETIGVAKYIKFRKEILLRAYSDKV